MKSLAGKFSRVSATDYHDGVVLVGLCGDVWPHDLTAEQKHYIMSFYNMRPCLVELCPTWPEGIEPAYPAAKKNFINGFVLLKKPTPDPNP